METELDDADHGSKSQSAAGSGAGSGSGVASRQLSVVGAPVADSRINKEMLSQALAFGSRAAVGRVAWLELSHARLQKQLGEYGVPFGRFCPVYD